MTRALAKSPPKKARAARKRTVDVQPLLRELDALYPHADCELRWSTPFELLVATILSAQCTDVRVNLVTPTLFSRFPDATAMAAADRGEIEALVRTTGFYRNKAKHIQEASRLLVERHGGEVPVELPALLALPGVARKTANVVLGVAFGRAEGVVVDTHVGRLSRRLGLTGHDDPVRVERDLMALLPRERWVLFSHQVILHGRRVCAARSPKCGACTLAGSCPAATMKPGD